MTNIGEPQKEIICEPLEDPVPREVPAESPDEPDRVELPDRELIPA